MIFAVKSMKKKSVENIAFSKYTPSVFFVMSPFQLLCAIEAIREFCISEYKMVFVCNVGVEYEKRNEQMKSMALDFGVEYDYFSLDLLLSGIDCCGVEENKKYSRIFIGDYNATFLLELSEKYAKTQAILLYIDDGNSSITLLQGIRRDDRPSSWRSLLRWYKYDYKKKKSNRKKIYEKLGNRGIICSNCFYTIYNDIKSKKFIIYPNRLKNLVYKSCELNSNDEIIYVVGPAIDAYAKQNRIRIVDVESIMWNKLSELRSIYGSKEIVYIPHGRDRDVYVMDFCHMLGIKYMRIDETVEYYMVKNVKNPYAVYGINSTALLNIKRIYPKATVVNWFVDKKYDNSFYLFFKSVANYYKKNGIEIEVIKYPNLSFKERMNIVYNNIDGLLSSFL